MVFIILGIGFGLLCGSFVCYWFERRRTKTTLLLSDKWGDFVICP